MIATYSSLTTFAQCERKFYLRYIKQIAPRTQVQALYFGRVIHTCLEMLYRGATIQEVGDWLMSAHRIGEIEAVDLWKANAMIGGYHARYSTPDGFDPDWKILAVEQVIDPQKVINPRTKRSLRTFDFSGKPDLVIEKPDGTLWICDHKTAATISGAYLDRIWLDWQTVLYAYFVERIYGREVTGVIFNLLEKPALRKYKQSKSRKVAETDEEYQCRLIEWAFDARHYHREEIYLERWRIDQVPIQLIERAKQLQDTRRRGRWPQNFGHCYAFNRLCGYHALCASNNSPAVLQSEYEVRAAHEELAE